jgi:DNA polymerase-3 subunit alpha
MQSLIKPSELFKKVKELGQSAIGVTDYGTLSGAWDCLKYSQEAGIKLIMGCEFFFVDDLSDLDSNQRLKTIVLLAKNHAGYKNLLQLNKLANDNHIVLFKKVHPRIDWKLLEKYSNGLICLTGSAGGILGQLISTRKKEQAFEVCQKLHKIFNDDLGLEIQPNAVVRQANSYNDYLDQTLVNNQIIKFAKQLNIKIIPAVNSHYLLSSQWESHDVLLAIGSGQPIKSGARFKYTKNDFYVKSSEEVRSFFARLYPDDVEEWLANTAEFANRCEIPVWIDPKFTNPSGKELPEFPVCDQFDYLDFKTWLQKPDERFGTIDFLQALTEQASYLRYCCFKSLNKIPKEKTSEYISRLLEEFDVLEFHGFCSYMLMVADFLDYCRINNIKVGPGRGSVGGSLIAYMLDIHEADPIKYGLIFARFHNKSKVAYPDIDIDISPSGREQLHDYIRKKYGEDKVAHVSNVNTMTPKVYARDIARVFQYGGDTKTSVTIGTNLADSIPKEIKTMDDLFDKAPLLAEYAEKKYPELQKYAKDLAGKTKAWSTHAAGLIISKRPLVEIIPLRKDKDHNVSIEYEKERAEANGLVKCDTLGLETLLILEQTEELIRTTNKLVPKINYNEYDAKTYDLISSGNTLCVFQLGGSMGTIDLCKKIKPKCIEDISIINSLARPSARDIRESFIATRNGEKPVKLLHPSLERSFGGTLGFGLYEESLMYLAQDIAGWDLNEADRLRKLTKDKGKNPKKVAQWKQEFIDGAIKNNIEEHLAKRIWEEVVENFGGYGFNHSHSILYSFISYQTAFFKAHFPLEFLTANLISEVKSKAATSADNIIEIKNEIKKLGVKILPPNINKSSMVYQIVNDNTLMTSLDSLKFIGKDAVPEIIAKRPFASFDDFLSKVDGKKVKAPSVCALAASGCLDEFGISRKQIFLYASDYKKKLQVWNKKFRQSEFKYPWETLQDWTPREKFAMETYYLGEGLSGTFSEIYPGFFSNQACRFNLLPALYPLDKSVKTKKQKEQEMLVRTEDGILEGVITKIFEFTVKREKSKILGQVMAKMMVTDPYGSSIPVTLFPERLEMLKNKLHQRYGDKVKFDTGLAIKFSASANWYEDSFSLLFYDLKAIMPAPEMPTDREHKKVSMKISENKKKTKEIPDPDLLLEEIEDELDLEGMSEPEEEYLGKLEYDPFN